MRLGGWAVVAFTIAAAALRWWNAAIWPPGLEYDEGLQGLDALAVARGQFAIYFREAYREPLSIYLAAPFVGLLGKSTFAVRFASTLAGILTVPVAFVVVRDLTAAIGARRSRWIGVVAAGLSGLTLWPLIVSRTAIPAPFVPPLLGMAIWLLWRAWVRGNGWVAAGVVIGLVPYTYQPGKLLPFVLAGFVAVRFLVDRAEVHKRLSGIGKVAGVALIVASPLIVTYVTDPATLVGRANAVSIFRPALGSPLETAARTTVQVIGAFGIQGDPNWYHNLAGRPIWDPITFGLALVGLGVLVIRWHEPGPQLLAIWIAVMLVPGILSDDNNPNTLRLIGLVPAVFALPALGADHLLRWVRLGGVRFATALVGLTATGLSTATLFAQWAESPQALAARSGEPFRVVQRMNEMGDQPGLAFLLPISNGWPVERRYSHRSVEFLYRGAAPYQFVRIDDETPPERCRCDRLAVVRWNSGVHVDADPKGLTTYLAGREGIEVSRYAGPGFDLLTFDLVGLGSFDLRPLDRAPIDVGGRLTLIGSRLQQSAAGRAVAVETRWRTNRTGGDDKLSYRLVDGAGQVVSQIDRLLLDNNHLPTSRWQPGSESLDYVLLPLEPGTPPGAYWLEAVLYDGGPAENVNLGTVELTAPSVPVAVSELDLDFVTSIESGGAMLVGALTPVDTVAPGGILPMTLFWQARIDGPSIGQVEVSWMPVAGNKAVSTGVVSFRQMYPSNRWRAGELVAMRGQVTVPAEPGRYRVEIRVVDRGQVGVLDVDVRPE